MYGNSPIGDESSAVELTPEERENLRNGLSNVASRTRELLPGEFVVGSEIVPGTSGPRATIAVQPPVGHVVSADYSPDDDVTISPEERDDIATGLAASAALQVKDAMSENDTPTAK
ncbi:DUF5811 family protein [Halovenus rubra]|uniref:DUF5811 family protein n=2 Tax=Halovenus rubra TaxID=869890 RepID=A0ACC7DYJ6_9EURY|nr:DUF5811 family protein [Halovenus rubra]